MSCLRYAMHKILVIDRDVLMDNLLEILKLEGYEVHGETSGVKGAERAISHPPDLILCAIRLSGFSGWTVLHRVRSNPVTARIPFFFLSVFTSSEDMYKAMEMGANEYIIKPFDVHDLLRRIHRYLES